MLELQTIPDGAVPHSDRWTPCNPGFPKKEAWQRADNRGWAIWLRDANGTVCRVRPLHPDRVWRKHEPCAGALGPPEARGRVLDVRLANGETLTDVKEWTLCWSVRVSPRIRIVAWRFAE